MGWRPKLTGRAGRARLCLSECAREPGVDYSLWSAESAHGEKIWSERVV